MASSSDNSKFLLEHYPYNKLLIIKHNTLNESLKINTKKFTLHEELTDSHLLSHAFKVSYKADAIYGRIKLAHHTYLVVVNKSRYVGRILGKCVYQVISVAFINITKDSEVKDAPAQNLPDDCIDDFYISMLKEHLNSGAVYFSHDYLLSNTLQSQLSDETDAGVFDSAFYINSGFAEKFLSLKGNSRAFLSGFIFGFVEQKDLFLKTGKVATFTLISRKHVKRLGTRFYSRGIDLNGFVSNFVETEAILEITDNEVSRRIFSHVQVRGSIPLFWSQMPTLKYTPKIELEKNEQSNENAMKLHFKRITKKYNLIQCINLIDKKGSQLSIGSAFERVFNKLREPDSELGSLINLTWFDYHHECRNMNFSAIRKLLEHIKENVQNFGFFEASVVFGENSVKTVIKKIQKGVVRTNCIDCLDRTNVFQSVYSRLIFNQIFAHLGLGPELFDCLTPLPSFIESTFRDFWTDNANALSRLYSGTDALKTDVTRLGKRTYRGCMNDGKNSIVRYFINNLYDSHTQNSLDLLTENLKPEQLSLYEKKEVAGFILRIMLLVFLPVFVCFLFWVFGIRRNSGLVYMLTSLSVLASYLYVSG